MPLAVRMLIEVWRKRSLWNPMVLLHVCHPKESCLGEPQCHQEHLGNSLRCLYNINLSHISIAGSCVIISSHVLSWRGPLTEQKAGVERLILLGTEHRQSSSPKVCSLLPRHRLKTSELQSARLKHRGTSLWQEDVTSETGCIWDANGPKQSKVSQGLADITQPALWSFGTALQRETNLKALRRCSLFK